MATGLNLTGEVIKVGIPIARSAIEQAPAIINSTRTVLQTINSDENRERGDAPRYMGWGGRMVMIGMPHSGAMAEYEPVVMAFMGQGMIGSKMGDVVIRRDIPWLADLYRQDRLKLDELVSGRWSLDQINEAIADTKAGGAKRNVILF